MKTRILLLFTLILFLAMIPLTASAQIYGNVWSVTYFKTSDSLDGDSVFGTLDRLDTNFQTAGVLPADVDSNKFSLRATSSNFFQEGIYRFQVGSDDGVRVFVNNVQILDAWVPQQFATYNYSVDVFVPQGTFEVKVEYYQNSGGAQLAVNWLLQSVSNGAGTEVRLITGTSPTLIAVGVAPIMSNIMGDVQIARGLSVRTGPYLGASRVAIIEPGTQYPVFARNTREGEFTWYLITVQRLTTTTTVDPVTGIETSTETISGEPVTGWVSGRYFFLNGDSNALPLQDSVFATLTNPASTGVQGITRSNMRLRQGPSYRTPTLDFIDWGGEFEIVSRTVQAGENHWYQVIHEGQLGWVFAPFTTINGDINLVPTY